jgi:hypothetical protein
MSRSFADGETIVQVSAWNNGASTFGIRVGIPNRDAYFDQTWTEIEVEIDGQAHQFALTPEFWSQCPEFRDRGSPVIREWLRLHHTLVWPSGHPPRFELVSLDGNRFRLVS